ncbi:hypothetical protein Tco_1363104 [Tanacetum coccineum]
MESLPESNHTVSALKLPILKTGEYELWSMRMELYMLHTDHNLWDIVVNGNAPVAVAAAGASGKVAPKTAKELQQRKNELKAESTLLLGILDEHLLKFHGIQDARFLWEAIKNRFGRNKESKKMQKAVLKQQFKSFTASRGESLDRIYDRSLPSAWNTHALIIKNKGDLKTVTIDDLYHNLKVYEGEIKGQSSSNSNTQNVAFISVENTSSTNEIVNIADNTASTHDQASPSPSTYADEDMCSFFATQFNTPQLDNEDLEHIRRTAEEASINFALMAYPSLSSSSSSDSEVHTCSKECLKSFETLQKQYDEQKEKLNRASLEIICYQIGLESIKARLLVHEKNEATYEESIEFLKYDVRVRDAEIKQLKNQLDEALKEKDDLKLKLHKFDTSSKKLTKLINSQISVNDKTGLGYDSQFNESEVVYSVSSNRDSDVDDNPVNDRSKIVKGFHVVPPPYTGNYLPPRADLSFARLDDSVYRFGMSKSQANETVVKPIKDETNKVELKSVPELVINKSRVFNDAPS